MAMVDPVVIAVQDQGVAERRRNLDPAHMSAESAQDKILSHVKKSFV
jgi:hypothetical protein